MRLDSDRDLNAMLDFPAPAPPLSAIHARAYATGKRRLQRCLFGAIFATLAATFVVGGVFSKTTDTAVPIPSYEPLIPAPIASAAPPHYRQNTSAPNPKPAPAPLMT